MRTSDLSTPIRTPELGLLRSNLFVGSVALPERVFFTEVKKQRGNVGISVPFVCINKATETF